MHGNGIAIGSGLLNGRVNVFNDFIVHTTVDQESGLSISIEGPSNVQLRHIDNQDGSIKVQYKPQLSGFYKIIIKQNGIHVKGSPFEVAVFDPQVEPEPFIPKSCVEMENENYPPGAFGDVSRVKVSGRGLYRGITNVQSEIIVDTRKAGLGRVSWSITGAGKPQTRHINIVSGLHKLLYVTDKKGLYVVRIKFNEQDIPGSPYKLRIM